MSLSLEDYIAKNRKTNTDICFKVSNQYRRFKVHTNQETYVFPWMHVAYATLSLDEGEIIIYLPQHVIEIIGDHLKPIYETIAQDSLEFVRIMPREMLSAEAAEGTAVHDIKVRERSTIKDGIRKKTE